jgi:hypothetical protein
LALTAVSFFDDHPPMNALPQAGLRGKCFARPESDFSSDGEGNSIAGADRFTDVSLATAQDWGCE